MEPMEGEKKDKPQKHVGPRQKPKFKGELNLTWGAIFVMGGYLVLVLGIVLALFCVLNM